LVVKNGSNTRSRTSGDMPTPVSRTCTAWNVGAVAAGGDGQDPAVRHGVAGVDRQVQQRRLQLGRVDVGAELASAGDRSMVTASPTAWRISGAKSRIRR
jgi:hypothetical protein